MTEYDTQYELRNICSAIYDVSRAMERRDDLLLKIAKNLRHIGASLDSIAKSIAVLEPITEGMRPAIYDPEHYTEDAKL